jgi:hypothetical protein
MMQIHLDYCTAEKKIAVNITDGSFKITVYFNLFLAVLTHLLPTVVTQ